MPGRQRVLAVILARGGSKGIPGKNLRALAGVPLIGRGVELLRQSQVCDRIIVSTDDDEIAEMATQYGADVPFRRPPELADDNAPSLPALLHAVRSVVSAADPFETTLLYQVTSPLCTAAQIQAAVAQFHATDATALKSVVAVTEPPHWMGAIEGGLLRYLFAERATRRQDLPPYYRLNGALSVYCTDALLREETEQGAPGAFIMDQESSLDIDVEADWIRAESVLER